MAWTTPRRWVTGDQITASLLNTYLRDNLWKLREDLFEYRTDWPSGVTVTAGTATSFTQMLNGATTLGAIGHATGTLIAKVRGRSVVSASAVTCRVRFNLFSPAGVTNATRWEVIADNLYATGYYAHWTLIGVWHYTPSGSPGLAIEYAVSSGNVTIDFCYGYTRQMLGAS